MGGGTSKAQSKPANDRPVVIEKLTTDHVRKIHSAIRWNKSMDEVNRLLLMSPAAVDCPDEKNGNTPIHIAAQNGHLPIVELLIKLKANVNAKNAKGQTALHMAVGYDYYDVAKVLLKAGADTSICNEAGYSADKGLEGDKSLAACALANATNLKEYQDGVALLLRANPRGMQKAAFVQTGLRIKKIAGKEWTQKVQDDFRNIIDHWDESTESLSLPGSQIKK